MKDIPGSLMGQNMRPLCVNHRPVADLTREGLAEIFCPNCGYRATMSIDTYIEFTEGHGVNAENNEQ